MITKMKLSPTHYRLFWKGVYIGDARKHADKAWYFHPAKDRPLHEDALLALAEVIQYIDLGIR